MKREIVRADTWYKSIKAHKHKYRLVNGLFIVRYFNNDALNNQSTCFYVGEFLRSGIGRNTGKTNKIILHHSENPQLFNAKTLETNTGLGWRKLNIGFIETPIEEILE